MMADHRWLPILCMLFFRCFFIAPFALGSDNEGQIKYRTLRLNMVENQIKARGITDQKLLRALQVVERHRFVPKPLRSLAYQDHPLPIGHGQTISQPYIVALMTRLLDLDKDKKVLEIGTGSGYQAAIAARLCKSVYTIEIIKALGKRADALFKELGYDNIHVKIGDGYQGWKPFSPYDAVIVTCAPSHIPRPLTDQLAEGGKLVIPVGEKFSQQLVLLTKKRGTITRQAVIPVRFVPMMTNNGEAY